MLECWAIKHRNKGKIIYSGTLWLHLTTATRFITFHLSEDFYFCINTLQTVFSYFSLTTVLCCVYKQSISDKNNLTNHRLVMRPVTIFLSLSIALYSCVCARARVCMCVCSIILTLKFILLSAALLMQVKTQSIFNQYSTFVIHI